MRYILTTPVALVLSLALATPASAHFSQIFGRLNFDFATTTGSISPSRGLCEGRAIDRLTPDFGLIDL